ncbi:uncharacterized protein LOC125542804 isoform X2 [Triticum urartu]|uniref:uncharacterized protein LOC125542804 isoform X2 n=1 Tax=Triticum urartu TaxID=4572 RepID=UPI0020438E01|nr:uncharacterized protein LOC125542804 isoform X2 [Triticum urartu]XP_048561946.1 uncharacterized protein LOC125542804 isoform X2 [Triticum urartu]XP_048561947.1 uncharacterized protein LOC125542804 isoform X2 [Triticum urartu]
MEYYIKKNDRVELIAILGLFGLLVSTIQIKYSCDHLTLQNIRFSTNGTCGACVIPGSDVSGHAPFLCGFECRGMWWLFVRCINGWCCHQEQSSVTIIDIVFKWMAEIDLEVIVYVLSTWYHITLWNGMEEVAITTGEEDAYVLLDMLLLVSIRKRGCTTVKMLNPMETAKFRLIVKQAKALKICNNHLLHTKKRQPAATWFGRAVNCLS